MRVLLLHNRYRHAGGEERAVADIARLLREDGHHVSVLERTSEAAGRAQAARGMLQGGLDAQEVRQVVESAAIDVVHAHNLHPLFGWRALAAAREAGARTVLHLHNFRLFCAIAVGYRDERRCFRCRGRHTVPGVMLRCRGSVGEAAVYAAGLARQQPRLLEHADRLVAVSAAALARLRWLGLPAGRSLALENFVHREGFADRSCADAGEYALVAGRLVPEKGFDVAIAAAQRAGVPLLVAGDGPDETRLRALAGPSVRFTGRLSEAELAAARRRAGIVLVPSRWEEPCPYAVLDAHAAGVPVIGSALGGVEELVGPGQALPPRDLDAWTQAVARLWDDPEVRREQGDLALSRARQRHSPEAYLKRLLEIYAR